MINRIISNYNLSKDKIRGIGFLIGGFLIALLAQLTLNLSLNQPGFWDIPNWGSSIIPNSSPLSGLILYGLACWIFIRGVIILDIPTTFIIPLIENKSTKPKFGFWITSIGLIIIVSILSTTPFANSNGHLLALLWVLGIFLLVINVILLSAWRPISISNLKSFFTNHWMEIILVAIIVITAFFIRYQGVELHPYAFINDEGEMGNGGSCIFEGDCTNLFGQGWAGQPMLAFFPTGLSVWLFGHTAMAVRLVSVIFGTLSVLFTYLFTREVFGKKQAFVAASLLATLPLNVHFSRIGVDNIIDSVSTTATLWFLFRGIKRKSTLSYLFSGILSGLSIATYPGSRLAPIMILLVIGFGVLNSRDFLKSHSRNIAFLILGFVITAAPFLAYFYLHPEIFGSRMLREGIFWNHSFENQQINGRNMFEIITDQFLRSTLVFIITPAPSNFFNSPNPYLTDIAAVFFILGLAYTLRKFLDIRYITVFIWFWISVILGSVITGGPPTSQRMLMSTPALVIVIAIGLTKFLELIPFEGKVYQRVSNFLLLIFVLYFGYQNISFYFQDYKAGHYFEDPTNEFSFETRTLITPLHTTGRLFLLSTPGEPFLTFANFEYFSPDVEKFYLDEVTPEYISSLPNDKDVLFIATADRQPDLIYLTKVFPGGELKEFKRRYQPDKLLFLSYMVKKSQLIQSQP